MVKFSPLTLLTFSNRVACICTMVASSPEKYFSRMSLDVTSGGQSTHGKFTSVARDLYVVVPGPMIWLGDRITFGVINQGTQWTKFHIGVKRA